MKSIKAGETVNYLNREHLLEEVTEHGVKLKRVNALPNEYSIYIRKGSERFFKIFSKDFDVTDIEVTDDEGVDVRLEKPSKAIEADEEDESNFNDFLVNLTKAHTTFQTKEEVTDFLKYNLFNFEDPLNELKRFAVSCWLNRRILVKFQTDSIDKYLPLVKNRNNSYNDELRLFIESALGDITEPSAKEVKSLVALIPLEDEELILTVIKGFDLPVLWLNQIEVKQMLKEADDASKTKLNKKREIIMTTIKGLSNTTVSEMLALFEAEAEKRGLIETVEEEIDEEEIEDDINLEAMNLKELKAYCKENDIDTTGLKTKEDILALFDEEDEEEIEEDEEDEEEEVAPVKKSKTPAKKSAPVEEDEDEDEEIEEDEIEDAEEDEEFEPYTEEELEEMDLKDLREIASEDFEIKGAVKMKKPALVEAILDAQGGEAEDEEDDEDEEEEVATPAKKSAKKAPAPVEDEEDDEEDEEEEDEDGMPDYASMNLKQLRDECKKEDIEFKGLAKEDLVDELEALWA